LGREKESTSVKWLFVSLTVGLTALGFFGIGRTPTEPTVEVECMQVPYQFAHVFSDGAGDEVVVEFHDAESQIDYSSRIPGAEGRAIIAWQDKNKIGQNYEESRLAARRHHK
jgi:hypothetical protein